MARKRLNLGFLLPVTFVALILGFGAFAFLKYRRPHNPAPYITAGDAAYKAGDINTAAGNYQAAVDLLPQRGDLREKLGRCYYQMAMGGGNTLSQASDQFTRAADLDPKSKTAWAGLLDVNEQYVEFFETHPNDVHRRDALSPLIASLRDAANHLKQLDPGNVQAAAALPILDLRLWQLRFTLPDSPDDLKLAPEKRPTLRSKG